jgi:hypothetical protein
MNRLIKISRNSNKLQIKKSVQLKTNKSDQKTEMAYQEEN